MNKWRELGKSRRFLAAVSGAAVMLLVVYVPELEPVEEQIIDLVVEILLVF